MPGSRPDPDKDLPCSCGVPLSGDILLGNFSHLYFFDPRSTTVDTLHLALSSEAWHELKIGTLTIRGVISKWAPAAGVTLPPKHWADVQCFQCQRRCLVLLMFNTHPLPSLLFSKLQPMYLRPCTIDQVTWTLSQPLRTPCQWLWAIKMVLCELW